MLQQSVAGEAAHFGKIDAAAGSKKGGFQLGHSMGK